MTYEQKKRLEIEIDNANGDLSKVDWKLQENKDSLLAIRVALFQSASDELKNSIIHNENTVNLFILNRTIIKKIDDMLAALDTFLDAKMSNNWAEMDALLEKVRVLSNNRNCVISFLDNIEERIKEGKHY